MLFELPPLRVWLIVSCTELVDIEFVFELVSSLVDSSSWGGTVDTGGDAAELSLVELLRLGRGHAGQCQQGRDGTKQGSHRIPPRVDVEGLKKLFPEVSLAGSASDPIQALFGPLSCLDLGSTSSAVEKSAR